MSPTRFLAYSGKWRQLAEQLVSNQAEVKSHNGIKAAGPPTRTGYLLETLYITRDTP
jgi:hypothetical protein